MKRVLSKQARFRIYLCCLTLVYLVVFSCVLRLNTLSHRREMVRLEKRFEEISRSAAPVSSPAENSVSSLVDEPSSASEEPRYFPIGSGRTGKWGYLDVAFPDASVRRYYFRIGVPRDLDKMIYRLELDSYFVRHSIMFPPSGGGVRGEAPEKFFED